MNGAKKIGASQKVTSLVSIFEIFNLEAKV